MYTKANHFSCVQGQRHSGPIERNSDDVLIIREIPSNPYYRKLVLITAGFIAVITILSAVTSQSLSAVLALSLILPGSIAFISRQTFTEINFADGTIRQTWQIRAYARHKVYSLNDFVTVEIKDKGRMIEGYSLPFYSVQLIGRGNQITIYSTEDPEEAKAVQEEIAEFLKNQTSRHS